MAKKFTKEELAFIANEVKNHPSNLKALFDVIGPKLDRSPMSVCSAWYKKIKYNGKYFGLHNTPANTKNVPRISQEQKMKRISNQIKQTTDLNKLKTLKKALHDLQGKL